jgi:hypothetical protein
VLLDCNVGAWSSGATSSIGVPNGVAGNAESSIFASVSYGSSASVSPVS